MLWKRKTARQAQPAPEQPAQEQPAQAQAAQQQPVPAAPGNKAPAQKQQPEKEPQYYRSATNIPTLNYNVYTMTLLEKVLYTALAFVAGALVGYLFYGGIGVDEFGEPTTLTYVLNTVIMVGLGTLAARLFLPMRNEQLRIARQSKLKTQFRDMLEAISTSLSAGKNVQDSFSSVYADLKNQYEEDAFILQELYVINAGLANGITIEELLDDFGKRSGCEDIQDFASVFEICYRKGGNIRDTIRNTYDILSDKMAIAEDIETVVTGSKSEQYLMLVMPVVLIGMIKVGSPDFAANFVTPSGLAATTIALALFVGSYFLGRIVLDIKV